MQLERKKKYRIVRPSRRGEGDLDDLARRLFGKGRRELVAEAAYYRSLRRAGGPGSPEQDWLAAEAEIDALLAGPLS